MPTATRVRAIQSLRELADLLEANPAVPTPEVFSAFPSMNDFRRMLGSIDGVLQHEREADRNWFTVVFPLPSGLSFRVHVDIPRPVFSPAWPEPIRPQEVQP